MQTDKIKAAFIGLGVMGYPMAGHLLGGGCQVCGYNRTRAKAEQWLAEYQSRGATTAATIGDAVANAEFVFACVGNDDDLRAITLGDGGAFNAMQPGAVFIDHTTASADIARALSREAAARNLAFLDAPVSGGQSGAENGVLTVMVGGQGATFKRAKPLMENYARAVTLMGDVGAGQLTKMVNQICIGGLVQSLSEAVAFAINAGLDARQVFEVIAKGAAQSWQMVNRAETMIDNKFDFGFAVDWMRKDLKLCFEEAARNGSQLPIAEIIDKYYAEIQKSGGNRLDTSSLITRLKRADLE